jgi:pyridoxal phosphate enzyme (YggS family)
MIRENLDFVMQGIQKACEKSGRSPDEVRLVCVTKEVGVTEAEELLALGVKDLGENRVQELVLKHSSIGDRATWHLIGHLQTNKVKEAVKIASLIHSVDSERLAREIDKEAKKLGKIQDVLIQVNVSGEESKFGIRPEEVTGLIKNIVLYPNINIAGFMTMAPEGDDPEEARPHFRRLRELREQIMTACVIARKGEALTKQSINSSIDRLLRSPEEKQQLPRNDRWGKLPVLSMGMTNDLEVAIEEGANIIRVGRAIFK